MSIDYENGVRVVTPPPLPLFPDFKMVPAGAARNEGELIQQQIGDVPREAMERIGLNPWFPRPVPEKDEAFWRHACTALESVTQIDRPIIVCVTPGDMVWDSTRGDWMLGAYIPLVSMIFVPASDRPGWTDHRLDTFAHEIAHYEQHRDKRPIIERGLEVRARTLLALAGLAVEAR